MDVGTLVGTGIGILLGTVINGILIWIVGKLGLGIKVDGFGSALIAGFLVALGAAIAAILWAVTGGTPTGGLAGVLINLFVAAAVLLAIGKVLKGVTVNGWAGAIIAAVSIAVVGWLLGQLLRMLQTG